MNTQKPKFRTLKKKRVQNGLDVDHLTKDHDPYVSMYKENYCNGTLVNSKKVKKNGKTAEDLTDLMSV